MYRSRKNLLLLGVLVVLLSGLSFDAARADEGDKDGAVTAPEAVMNAFHKAYPKATIKDVSMEDKDGKSYFEIESMDGGMERNILYLADGTVFEIEEEIAVADLPKAISATIKTAFVGSTAKKAERLSRGEVREYEVMLTGGDKRLEVLFDANGKVKSQKPVSDDDESADGEDEADED